MKENLEQIERLQMLHEAMLIIDLYLNAGYKEKRKEAAEKAKKLYKKYYGIDYKNFKDR